MLVLAHLCKSALRYFLIPPIRDERRHPADCVRAALVANTNEALRVCTHERNTHRDVRAIRQNEGVVMRKFLDDAEDVVPAACVQTGSMIAQLVQNLFHLECREDRFDEHGRADGAAWNSNSLLCEIEDIVPQTRFEMALHLRQVEVGATATIDQRLCIVEEVHSEIEQTRGNSFSLHLDMLFRQVPAAGADNQRRSLILQLVLLAFR